MEGYENLLAEDFEELLDSIDRQMMRLNTDSLSGLCKMGGFNMGIAEKLLGSIIRCCVESQYMVDQTSIGVPNTFARLVHRAQTAPTR